MTTTEFKMIEVTTKSDRIAAFSTESIFERCDCSLVQALLSWAIYHECQPSMTCFTGAFAPASSTVQLRLGKRSLSCSHGVGFRTPPVVTPITPTIPRGERSTSTSRTSPRHSLLHLANLSSTQQNKDSDLCIDGVDDELCSIDNLDACVTLEDDECCIDNLEACFDEEGNAKSSFLESNNSSGATQPFTLERFFAQPIVEVQLALLVVLSSLLVGLGTLDLPPSIASFTKNGELAISAIFTLEYLARWKLEDFSAKFVIKPLAVIDLIAILPGLIKFAVAVGISVPASFTGGALINLRLLRLLRLQRVLVDYETFKKFELALGLNISDTRPYQLQLSRIVISIFTLLSVTAGLVYTTEHRFNPEITDYFTSLYFSLTTLTTVGFGDVHPMTTAGRWVVSGAILVGSVVIPAQAAALVEALLDREGEKNTAGARRENDTDKDLALKSLASRMDRLEEKMEQTNQRIERILDLLEAKHLN